MKLVARILAVALIASLFALLGPASPASAALKCGYNHDLPTNSLKGCTGWGKVHKGASLTKPYSSYEYRKSDKTAVSLILNFRLADIRADGKCAWVRAKKTGAYAYDEYQPVPACGKGTSRIVNLEFKGIPNAAPGKFSLFLCGGQGNKRCTKVFAQNFPYP